MSRRSALDGNPTSESGVNRTDIPRIYHYPTKFRKAVANSTSGIPVVGALKFNYADALREVPAPKATGSLPPPIADANPNFQYRQHVDTFVAHVRAVPEILRTGSIKERLPVFRWRYLWLLVVPLLAASLYESLSQDHKFITPQEKAFEKVVDINELKDYVNQLVKQYTTQASTVVKDELNNRGNSLQEELRNIQRAVDSIRTDHQTITSKGDSKLSGIKDDLQKLDDRIAKLQSQQTVTDSKQISKKDLDQVRADIDQIKADITTLRRSIAEQQEKPVSPNPKPTPQKISDSELDRIQDEVFKRISSILPTKTTHTNPESVPSLSIEEVALEIQRQVRKSNSDLEEKVNTNMEERILAEEQKIKAVLDEKMKTGIEERVRGGEQKIKAEIEEMVNKAEGKSADELVTINQQINALRTKLQEVSAEAADATAQAGAAAKTAGVALDTATDAITTAGTASQAAQAASKTAGAASRAVEAASKTADTASETASVALRAAEAASKRAAAALEIAEAAPQGTHTPTQVPTHDEISPKLRELVRELILEHVPVTQPSQAPLDEDVINKLIEEVVKELAKKVDTISSGLTNLDNRVNTVNEQVLEQLAVKETHLASKIDELISEKIRALPLDSSSTAQLENLKREIMQAVKTMFNADKIGRVDWALASMGAQIVLSRTSETYTPVTQSVLQSVTSFIFGSPQGQPPTTILTRDTTPGMCWAFRGDRGHVAVKLPVEYPIRVTHVTIDHINASIAPNVASAPKNCIVWGLANETAPRVELGQFVYDISGEDIVQTFELQNPGEFPVVMLEVLSNHGFEEYTCIYRLRIHGDRKQESTEII